MTLISAHVLASLLMIVISPAEIRQAVTIGMPEQDMLDYFHELTIEEHIEFYTQSTQNTVGHILKDGEAGYYLIFIDDVRIRWWLPSLGGSITVVVAISDDREVTSVEVFGARSGWP